jgi:PAS domain-containing protein
MRAQTETPTDFIATFSRQRQQLLARAGQVMPSQPDALPGDGSQLVATQCLVTSLEELKVAEEEMLNQHLDLLTTRAEADRKMTYWRTLFDLAPTPLLLTTSDGVIRTANQATASLLTRDVYHLEGKPMVALVSNERSDFRTQLKRVMEAGGVSSWALTLERKTREPVNVVATITLMPSSLTGTTALYWSLREVTPPQV